MLTVERDIADKVRSKGYIMDHDIYFWSAFMGEPLLLNGNYIAYIDRKHLYIYTVSINSYEPIPMALLDDILLFSEDQQIDYIELWGDFPFRDFDKGHIQHSWRISQSESEDDNIGMQIDLAKYQLERDCKRLKQIRQLSRRGISTSVVTPEYLSLRYLDLIKRFVSSHALEDFDVPYTIDILKFLQSKYGVIIEARDHEDTVQGIGTLSTYLMNSCVFMHTFVNRDIKGISDAIYLKAIEYAKTHQFRFLDMGYSMNKGLKAYKISWGVNVIRGKIYTLQLFRGNYTIDGYYHWRERLLMSNMK